MGWRGKRKEMEEKKGNEKEEEEEEMGRLEKGK